MPMTFKSILFLLLKIEMIKLLSEGELIKLKEAAFNHGILLEDLMSVFRVYLRNKILADKGIHISEVDENTP